jgi:phage shock protein C
MGSFLMTERRETRHDHSMSENNGGGGKRLLRLREGRLLAGVCVGLAAYLGVDVNLVRLAFGVFTVFYGLGALVYLLAWLVLAQEGGDGSLLESFVGRRRL